MNLAKTKERERSRKRYHERKIKGVCRRCGKEKPKKNRTRCPNCALIDCSRDRGKYPSEHYQENKGIYRNWYYIKKYKITLEQYEKMLKKQGNKCAICGKSPEESMTSNKSRHLDVNHNHNTGEIRGLLCASCNTAIGHFKENKELFAKAVKYIERISSPELK